jgi:hypothetical protein
VNWLLWRQHRTQAAITLAALAVFALAVLFTGLHMAHVYADARASCNGESCDFLGNLFQGYGAIVDTVHLTIALPLVIGLFLGVPLIARETDQSTHLLAWSQTVTRRRWLLTKISMALVGTVVLTAAVSALVTWWSNPSNALYGNRFEGAQFDTQNIVPIAQALFAVSLGIAAGAVLRRVLPALATTVGIFVFVRIIVAVYVRPHFMAPLTTTSQGLRSPDLPTGSWTISSSLVDTAGKTITQPVQVPARCLGAADVRSCVDQTVRLVTKYHPPSHYWHFQLVESGLFVALAAGAGLLRWLVVAGDVVLRCYEAAICRVAHTIGRLARRGRPVPGVVQSSVATSARR